MGPRASLALAAALLLWPPAAAAELSDLAAPALDGDLTASALDGDDECAAVGGPGCALEALQKRGEAIRRAPVEPAGAGQQAEPVGQPEPRPPSLEPLSQWRPRSQWVRRPQPPCLCVFDVDRTLTSKQGVVGGRCGGNARAEAADEAYGGGQLTLSEVAAHALAGTFCEECYLGICTHGDASGHDSEERNLLVDRVLLSRPIVRLRQQSGARLFWSRGAVTKWNEEPQAPMVVTLPDGLKQVAVKNIVDWYAHWQGVQIADRDVHFFDDRADNVEPFARTNYSARQVSCHTRDPDLGQGVVGLCGAMRREIVPDKGIHLCRTDCAWAPWSRWSGCLGCWNSWNIMGWFRHKKGQRERSRKVALRAMGGGRGCLGGNRETEECWCR